MKVNENYLNLEESYLFPKIAKKTAEFKAQNPAAKVISLGIGDVTRPLAPAVIDAMQKAVAEMGDIKTFRGYGPEQGYDFLINAIIANDYKTRGICLDKDEVFVSDGAKCDVGNIQEIFSADSVVLLTDPIYPVYRDTNIMAGRKFLKVPATKENNFTPLPPKEHSDIVYICSPNNPTGATMSKEQLKQWVAYAKREQAIIIYDSAYEAYIQDDNLPHSIYEIEGAKDVAIEVRSYSKTAGFTGTRCAYMVVPKALKGFANGKEISLNAMWRRRHTTKFNGVSYIIQRGAEAIYTDEGKKQIKQTIAYYMENARIILDALKGLGYAVYGGQNAPYIWLEVPKGQTSFGFFELLLNKCALVCTPGAGFGDAGEGYCRLTAFGSRENTLEALERIKKL